MALSDERRFLPGAVLKAGMFLSGCIALEIFAPLASLKDPAGWTFWLGVSGRAALFGAVILVLFRLSGSVARESRANAEGTNAALPGDLSPSGPTEGDPRITQADHFRHKILSPLGAAFGFLELLRDGKGGELTALQREYIDCMHGALQEAMSMIDARLGASISRTN